MLNNSKFCCYEMEYSVTEERTEILYEPEIRVYDLILHSCPDGNRRQIIYCPWCGTKLPKALDEEREEILKKEYGIKDPCGEDRELVPLEFRTDEWWKKRGL